VIADDLTGAADCVATPATLGCSAVVLLHSPNHLNFDADRPDADILSIDANSRCLPAQQATELIAELVDLCDSRKEHRGGYVLFKKIDSTLRGNVAGELAALLRARRAGNPSSSHLSILMAPALPSQRRTTVGGRLMVNGVPLEKTDIWQTEVCTPESDIRRLLADAGLSSGLVYLNTVRSGLANLRQAVRQAASHVDVVVCDAESDSDLRAIIEASLGDPALTAFAGSAGLASQIPQAIRMVPDTERRVWCFARGSTLFVVGTTASVSRQQARFLQAIPEIATFHATPAGLLNSSIMHTEITQSLQAGRDVLLVLDEGEHCSNHDAQFLPQALSALLSDCPRFLGGLVATGGDTARATLDALGIHRLRLLGEVEAGLPFSVADRWIRPLPVITKAGAFGSPQALVRCHQFLRELERARTSPFEASVVAPRELIMQKPIVAITMGDAAGVGPEIIMKSLSHPEVHELCCPLVIGDADRLRSAGAIVSSQLEVHGLPDSQLENATFSNGTVNCVDLKLLPAHLPWGRLSREAGEAAYRYLELAARLAMEGRVATICTAPLNKEAMQSAGHKFPGHTEALAHLTGTPEVSMMLTTPKLKVLHVTTHIGLIDAIARIEPGLVERTIARGQEALERSGITNPRIGVCGINPHAGENGLFGHGEEEEKIVPAIEACRKRGWNIEGPLPADTLFYRAQRGDFDLVIAMYHDQGHGPVKVLGLESGVNITIGLPVVRTSVDHGTAFDIAGTGKADERSLIEAIRQAVQLAPKWHPGSTGFR